MWRLAQRGWWSLGLLSVGCVAQFPTFVEDAGSSSLRPDSGALDAAASDGPSPPIQADAAAESPPDATPMDASGGAQPLAPDASPAVPLSATLTVNEFRAALPCGRRDVNVSWTSSGALGCAMRTLPEDVFDAPALPPNGDRLLIALDLPAVDFVLTCRSDEGGSVEQVVDLKQATNLPPQTMFPNRDAVRAEQRRCALALGQTPISDAAQDAGFVNLDAVSAGQICRCAGYQSAPNFMQAGNRATCFASPGNNTIGHYETGGPSWFIRRAMGQDRCIDTLLCSGPDEYCDSLIAPLPASP